MREADMYSRFILMLTTFLVLSNAVAAAPFYIGNSPLVPPTDGVYLSPQSVHAEYSGPGLTVILKDIQHTGFANIVRTPLGGNTTETFDSTVFGNVSINGGGFIPISLTGPVEVLLFGYTPGDIGTFATEMVQLALSGVGVLLRESPTQASTGQTKIQDLGVGGPYRIDSFFDVFTELSLDGGTTWIPSQGSTRVDLSNIPLPATWLMFLSGFALLGFARCKRSLSIV
jgi:hypothetical protein